MWKRKLKLGTALYVLARYSALIYIALSVLILNSNLSFLVRFVSIPKSLEWHYFNIVSSKTIPQVQFLCHVRTCNLVLRFTDILSFIYVIGVQGNNDLLCQCRTVDGLCSCRPFASASLCYFWSPKACLRRSWVAWGLHHYIIFGSLSYQCRVGTCVTNTYTSQQSFCTAVTWAAQQSAPFTSEWSLLPPGPVHWGYTNPCWCIRCKIS